MSGKFKSIEFFGISGSGKSYIASIVKKKLEKKGFTVLNARECITKGTKNYIKINLIEKISLNYFKLINLRNSRKKNNALPNQKSHNLNSRNYGSTKTNYLKDTYLGICKKISKKNHKFFTTLKKVENIFLNPSKKEQQYLFWFYELVASHIIFKKIFKSKKYILLLDEGLIQRSFILNNNLSKKQKSRFLDLYFAKFPFSELIFHISNIKELIIKINKLRKKSQIHKYKDLKEMKNNYQYLNNYLLAKKKFKYRKIDNNKNVEKMINNFFN